jgi:penicillin-binding protein-related factor A (putative recombinase)
MYSHIHQVLYIELSYRIHRTVAFAFICFLEKYHTYFMKQKLFLEVKNEAKKQQN